jgi:hypothetical protein
MSTEKSGLLERLTAKGMLNLPEGSEPSGEADPGNNKLRIDQWTAVLDQSQDGMLLVSCIVTPVSPFYTIQSMGLYATATGNDKLAVIAIVGPKSLQVGQQSASLTAGTNLFDPNVEGNVIDGLIYGHVMVGNETSEPFSFEKKFVLET